MALLDGFKIRSALMHHRRGDTAAACAAYEHLYQQGCLRSAYMLPWSILLLREGGEENFRKAKEILAKAQKAPDLSPANRTELLLNYAVADYKLGDIDKAVDLLERAHRKSPSGDTYGALGYLYIEQGDAEKALTLNTAALEYDEEDPVVLDNLGQIHYRLLDDKEKALEYFNKAHEIKPSQIDTLWFLSRYDVEAGRTQDAVEKLETALDGRFSPLNYATKSKIESELARLRG